MSPTATHAFTDDGAWCWFQDPRAVRYTGDRDRTYTGWVTVGGDIDVGSYDHDTGEVVRTTVHADFERDDHDAPTVCFDTDGRALVFYTGHGGPEIRYRRSTDPEDVSAFGPHRAIAPSTAHTYPDPREVGDALYLFYRNANGSVAYTTSDDDGRSWSAERELVTTGGRGWCVYRKISDVRDGTVDMGLTFAEGGTSDPHRSVRHVRFDGERLRGADGTPLGDGGEGVALGETPPVYDSAETGHDAWVWDCATHDGTTELVYAELRSEDDHRYRYARLDERASGDGWTDVALADAGTHIVSETDETYYSGGVVLDHERPGVCYYSTGSHGGSELVRAETADGGRTWQRTVVADGDVQNVRPVVPRNRREDLPVLWMRGSYTHYADAYGTSIVGAAGPLEADR